MPEEPVALNEMLKFWPGPIFDPVPPFLLKYLDERVLRELAVVQIRYQRAALEATRGLMDARLEALAQAEKLFAG